MIKQKVVIYLELEKKLDLPEVIKLDHIISRGISAALLGAMATGSGTAGAKEGR